MLFWSSTLDQLLDDSILEQPKPNPFPPLGSGKKSRPALLFIPDFDPPPPTPSPLFLLQFAPKPAKPTWNPPQERRRRPKVWDLMPDLPPAVEPQQHLIEPAHASRKVLSCSGPEKIKSDGRLGSNLKVTAPPVKSDPGKKLSKALPRQYATADLTAVAQSHRGEPSPTTADILQQAIGYELGVLAANYPERVPGCRPSRDAFHCGVDLSALWSAVVDFVFSPSEKLMHHQSCLDVAGRRELEQAGPQSSCSEQAVRVPAEFFGSANAVQKGTLHPHKDPLHSLKQQAANHGKYSSPISVLTPLSTEKSSADSSPFAQSLLAFVERDSS